jgi:hypothetical protein
MSDRNESSVESGRIGRRRMLLGMGGGGLALATSLFGGTVSAEASNWQCCNLAYLNNNHWAACSAHSEYTWGCTADGGFLHCLCCERYTVRMSGGTCQYG